MRRLAEVLAFAPPDQCQRKPRLTQEGRQDDSSRRSDVRHSWYDKGLGVRRTEADGNRVSTTIGRHVWARATELRWRSMEMFRKCIVFLSFLLTLYPAVVGQPEYSIARIWNEQLLEAIRNDFARPTIHARNLFHTSIAVWDAWAAYDPLALNYLHPEKARASDISEARKATISYASYRILRFRFVNSPGAEESLTAFDAQMAELGYDVEFADTVGASPAALGHRIAAAVLAFGTADGSNEEGGFENTFYEPLNPPLVPVLPGNPDILDPNRWQPLALDVFIDQAVNVFLFGVPAFLSPEWGQVTPFALTENELTIYQENGNRYLLYRDPGPPPMIGGDGDGLYRSGIDQVLEWSGLLDPTDGVMIDISPNARGNNTLRTNDGHGYEVNPKTGLPYVPEIVPAGDYFRVLAEFWADGPDSETPPGHWFTIANYVSDHPQLHKRIAGAGPIVNNLEWDVKIYLALAGAVHDSAVAAWGAKGWYDYVRPISSIRYLSGYGQSSDPDGPSYHPNGIHLRPGWVEVISEESVAEGERHAHLAGIRNRNVGRIAVRAWRGPDFIAEPSTDTAGVGWILGENWWPYQRPSFVTPPFAGYVSGHSTFSRAAAELLTLFTGDPFFPGGQGEFFAPQNEFLVFEDGPSVDITLRWATYRDASDETSISRIYGGIHPTADDIPGRLMGADIGPAAFFLAAKYFGPFSTIDLESAAFWQIGRRLYVSAQGSFPTGLYGEGDVFNLSQGVELTLIDNQGKRIPLNFSAGECVGQRDGSIRCADDSSSARGHFRDSYSSSTVRFRVLAGEDQLVQFNLNIIDSSTLGTNEGPFRLNIKTGDVERTGKSAPCASQLGVLYCR